MQRSLLILPVLAGFLVPAGVATADKPIGGIRTAVFDVTLKGKQANTWTSHHDKASQCDFTYDGEGGERMRFNTKRKVRVVVTSFSNTAPLSVRLKGATIGDIAGGDIDIKGRATRHATDAISGWDPKCGGKGGGGQEAPDCGTRSFDNASAMLSFQPGDKLSLDGGLMPGTPVFSNCKLLGTGAPTLLSTDSSFRPIASKFPRREVFDKSLGKVIVIGRGKQVRTDAETSDTTRIRWEATFVRVRKG